MIGPESMFVNTVTVYAPTETTGADGSTTTSLTGTAGVPCSLQPLSASESLKFGRDDASVFARGYFAMDAALDVKTEIVDEDNVRWRVVGMGRNTGGRSVFKTVDLERVT